MRMFTDPELTVEAENDGHVDEIAEEHRGVDIANEQGLTTITTEINDRLEKQRTPANIPPPISSVFCSTCKD